MIDVHLPLRKAYYELLNNAVQYNSLPVPVGDELKPFAATVPVYIVLSTQTDRDQSTFQSFDSEHDINIEIVFKAQSRGNKGVLDLIASQVLNLVLPAPAQNGLPPQTGIQILCVRKTTDTDLALALNTSNTVIRRIITFRQYIRQTLDNTPVVGLKGIIRVTSSDFANAADYVNTSLVNQFEVFDNDASVFLEYGVDLVYLAGGGFTILIDGWDSTLQSHVLYVLLK